MKGLLIKDLRLMLNQKQFFLMIIVIGLIMSLTLSDSGFISGYVSCVFPLFTISTISYDEYDNGNAFLFTLPFKRSTYVKEKYVFSIVISLIGMCISLLLVILSELTQIGQFNIVDVLLFQFNFVPVILLFLSILIPIQLKYGGENARIVLIGGTASVGIIGYLILQLISYLQIDLSQIIYYLSINEYILTIIVILLSLLFILLSEKISERIVKNKEF